MSRKHWMAFLGVVFVMGCPDMAPEEGEDEWPSLPDWAVSGRCLHFDQSLEYEDTVRGQPVSFYQGVASYSGTVPLLGHTVGLEADPTLVIGDMWGYLGWEAAVDCEGMSNQGWLTSLIDVDVVLEEYGLDYVEVGSARVYVWEDETWASVTVSIPGEELTELDLDPGYDLSLEIVLTEDVRVGMVGMLSDGMGDDCILFHTTGGADHLDWEDISYCD
jgi:hypothetical protein